MEGSNPTEPPNGLLGAAIRSSYGSLQALMQKINVEGADLQGSGWVWLSLDKEMKRLQIETTQNQDPLVTKGSNVVPLLGIDVWEHAYYLQYKNVKADYLKNIWKVMNWKYASDLYEKESAEVRNQLPIPWGKFVDTVKVFINNGGNV